MRPESEDCDTPKQRTSYIDVEVEAAGGAAGTVRADTTATMTTPGPTKSRQLAMHIVSPRHPRRTRAIDYVPRQGREDTMYIAMAATSVAIEDDSRCPVLYSDSGASETIINDIRLGRNFRRLDKRRRFAGAVKNGIKSYLTANYECEVLQFGLGLYSEEAAVNLLSEGALQQRGWSIQTSGEEDRLLTDPHGRV
jgi:hypothetical protein